MADLQTTLDATAWDRVAPGWDTFRHHVSDQKAPVTERLLAALQLGPGDDVLELGAGPGDLAVELHRLVEPGGSVLATDVSPAMVELTATTLAGRAGSRAQVADAADLHDLGQEFDAVVSRMGLMFLPDPAKGFAEAHRVLRPGGRIATAVWAGPEHNPWLTTVGMAVMGVGLPIVPPFGPGGPFSLGDPDHLAQLLLTAGFVDVAVEAVDFHFHFADAGMHVRTNCALAPNLAEAVEAAGPAEIEALHAAVAEADGAYLADGGLRIPGRALVAVGRR